MRSTYVMPNSVQTTMSLTDA